MASPQVEDGYTKIANELLEAFCREGLPKTMGQIWWAILRKTYGWNKTEKVVSLKEIQELTEEKLSNISRGIKKLSNRNMITIQKNSKGNLLFKIQKDYEKWGKPPIKNDNSKVKNDNSNSNKNDNSKVKNDNSKVKNDNSNPLKATTGIAQLSPKNNIKDNIKNTSKNTVVEIFNYWNKQEIIVHQKLNTSIENKIKKTLTLISVRQLIKAIHNYSQVLKSNAHYFSYKWTLTQFLERGLSKRGIDEKKGFWQFLPEAQPFVRFANGYNNTLTLNNWKPLTKDNLLNRDGLYFGFPFELVKQDIYSIKEHVDDSYFKYPELKVSSHFVWLEELLATLKYQRNNLPKGIDAGKYLSLWDSERKKPEVQEFIKEINNE